MNKVMRKTAHCFLLVVIFLNSCKESNLTFERPDWIFYNGTGTSIDNKGEKMSFNLTKNIYQHQSIYGWFNKSDHLIMSEDIRDPYSLDYISSSVFRVDLRKNILDTIFSSDLSKGEKVFGCRISNSDSIVIVPTLTTIAQNRTIASNFYSPLGIRVIEAKTGRILDSIERFYPYNLQIDIGLNNVFSPSDSSFVYCINDRRYFIDSYWENKYLTEKKPNGVYIYNISERTHKLVALDASDPIWSHKENLIVYHNHDGIWRYCPVSNEANLLYRLKKHRYVQVYQFTPDGKYLYLVTKMEAFWTRRGGIPKQEIVDLETGRRFSNKEIRDLPWYFHWK